jgi:hypothetical protein
MYTIFFRKPEGKRPPRRSGPIWEDDNRMDFEKMRWECVDSIPVAQDRDNWRAFVNTVMNLRVT